MARLSDMPYEITLMIVRLVSPDDIESFALACKDIYYVAYLTLMKHRALKKKHAAYHYYDPDVSGSRCSPSQLLDQILREPRTAFYVQNISLNDWCWKSLQIPVSERRQEHSPMPGLEKTTSILREEVSKTIAQCPFFNETNRQQTSDWLKFIDLGNEDPIIAALLLFLPNLSTLKADGLAGTHEYLNDTLYSIATWKGSGTPLLHLRHAHVADVKLLGILAALPSMKSIHGIGIRATDTETWPDDLVSPNSDVTDLVLTRCSISPKRLFGILGGFKALRSFTYDSAYWTAEPHVSDKVEFDSFWVRAGLSAYAASTLESLTLLSHDKDKNFMGEIRSFERLRYLHTESQLLLGELEHFRDSDLLARKLPPNLETLKLECSGVKDELGLAKRMEDLASGKKEYAPALSKVQLVTRNGVFDINSLPPMEDLAYRIHRTVYVERPDPHNFDAVVEACRIQGIELQVEEFEREVVELYRL